MIRREREPLTAGRELASGEALKARLAAAGYAAVIEQVEVGGRGWWRVVSAGYATREDAGAVAAALREPFALASPWASRMP